MDNVILPAGFGGIVQEVCVNFTAVDNSNLDDGNTIFIKIISAGADFEISADCLAEVKVSDDESELLFIHISPPPPPPPPLPQHVQGYGWS